ncbi:MAG: autotransporter domain-containing protein [Alphaproteobacteria bacterium]|nr:autotransporter domain-containing protein [Alphaproteobacteria bacterium]MBU1552195.1 autotransporter domain-containing protein [Alphaproteobacteria bacterium]MBU2336895.1 autotransporter domain-containing protein [Alphaproteobacteria bacterium]MBU2389652.1 autotransporter domain-containing protein [Alphaproteobacteria bacterium]
MDIFSRKPVFQSTGVSPVQRSPKKRLLRLSAALPLLAVPPLVIPAPLLAQQITTGGGRGGGIVEGELIGALGQGGIAAGGGGSGSYGYDNGENRAGGDGGSAATAINGMPMAGAAGADSPTNEGGRGGAEGNSGTPLADGGGGGGGAAGGLTAGGQGANGGNGNANSASMVVVETDIAGGNGTDGGPATIAGAGGGGGGGGGAGLLLSAQGTVVSILGSRISGGDGGLGTGPGYRGSGGGGAAAVVLLNGGSVTLSQGALGEVGSITGGRGGDGLVGGEGGAGVFLYDGGTLSLEAGSIAGGHGGNGDGISASGGAGVLSNLGNVWNDASITGGDGGSGPNYMQNSPVTGRPPYGDGGNGIKAWGGRIINAQNGMIAGGVGGGTDYENSTYPSGNGGAGVFFTDGQPAYLENHGTITGGTGGSWPTGYAQPGRGGAGVVGASSGGTHVINDGTITGALSGDGATRANAVSLFGSNNRFEFWSGSDVTGDVAVAAGGSDNAFVLGGAGDGAFDLSRLGPAGQFSGFDTFGKTGSSTWTVSGDAEPAMGWVIEEGTLLGSSNSIKGNVANAGILIFDEAADGVFSGDLSGFNGADGTAIKRGAGALRLAGSSILDWSVQDGELVVSAQRFSGDVALDGASTVLTFSDTSPQLYDGAISGNGILQFAGSYPVLLTGDSSTFTGTTRLLSGALLVGEGEPGASLGGNIEVLSGGVLSGSGTLGSGTGSRVTIGAGGVLAPGNSPGTLTIAGDLVLNPGSRFEVEVIPGTTIGDLVKVTGAATINGGTVAHVGANGAYDPSATYTILTAGNGVSGRFDGVTSDLAFLQPLLSYDNNAISLTLLRNDTGFATVAETANQAATAGAIEELQSTNELHRAMVQLSAVTAREALDQLSGEIHASVASTLIGNGQHLQHAANSRLRSDFTGTETVTIPVLGYIGEPYLASISEDAAPAYWMSGFGARGVSDSDGNAAAKSQSDGGVLLGIEGQRDSSRMGVLVGYSQFSLSPREGDATATSDSYHLGVYGGTNHGRMAVRSGLTFSAHEIETHRSVAFTGFSDSLTASYNANTLQAFGELGYELRAGDIQLEPFVNLAHVMTTADSFNEAGGAARISASRSVTHTTFTTLGLRAEHELTMETLTAKLTGSVGWQHAWGDVIPTLSQAFDGSSSYTIAGNPVARDSALIETGLEFELAPDVKLGVSYSRKVASRAQEHGARATLNMRF